MKKLTSIVVSILFALSLSGLAFAQATKEANPAPEPMKVEAKKAPAKKKTAKKTSKKKKAKKAKKAGSAEKAASAPEVK